MALSDNALVTVYEVKQFYFPDVKQSKSQDDNLFENLINRKTDQFEKYCGVTNFHANDYTDYYDSAGSYIFVKNSPLNSITSIYIDPEWVWGTDSTAVSTDYRIVDDRYVTFRYNLGEGNQDVKITYNAGYSEIPEDLKQACIEEVVRSFKHRRDFDVISKSLNNGSTTITENGLLTATKQVIDKYKRVLVA